MSHEDLLSSVSQYGLFSLRYSPVVNTSRVAKERRRNEFGLAIRHLFLRFLTKVESRTIQRLFTEAEINDIAHGSIDTFNVHHLRGLDIGGRNFNPDFIPDIKRIHLSNREVSGISLHCDWEHIVFGRRMEHYLEMQERRGQLKSAFHNLFAGYLVFMPRTLHKQLEEDIITPAIEDARENYKPTVLLPYTTQLIIDPESKAYKKLIKKGIVQSIAEAPVEIPTTITKPVSRRTAAQKVVAQTTTKKLSSTLKAPVKGQKRKPSTVTVSKHGKNQGGKKTQRSQYHQRDE